MPPPLPGVGNGVRLLPEALETLVFWIDWSAVPLALPRPWDVLRGCVPRAATASGLQRTDAELWSATSLQEHARSANVSLSLLNDFLRHRLPRLRLLSCCFAEVPKPWPLHRRRCESGAAFYEFDNVSDLPGEFPPVR